MSNIAEVSTLRTYGTMPFHAFTLIISSPEGLLAMIGKNTAQLSLQFGVDDLDGTINDSTKIYSMAGAEDQNPP